MNTSLRQDDTRVGIVLDVPIYQGGRVTSRTRQAKLLLDATGQDLDDVQRGVVRQAQDSYRAVLAGIQEVEAFRQAMISAESALEATQAGFEVGTRTIVDVLIAEQRKYQAQRDNSVARHAYILRHLQLKAVVGFWPANADGDDIAVFADDHEDRNLIKRVVGLPGDRIQMRNGVLYINGEAAKKAPWKAFPCMRNWSSGLVASSRAILNPSR